MTSAKDTRIDILDFDKMYRSNIQAHIDYESKMAGLDQNGKDKSKSINPGKKYSSFDDFVEDKMKDYSEVNYGDVVLTECGKEIKRISSNFKHNLVFKNPDDKKPTQGKFPKAHIK